MGLPSQLYYRTEELQICSYDWVSHSAYNPSCIWICCPTISVYRSRTLYWRFFGLCIVYSYKGVGPGRVLQDGHKALLWSYNTESLLCCPFFFCLKNLLSAGLRWQDPGWCVQTESLWRLGCHLGCVIMCLSVCSTQLFKSTQFLKSTQLCLPIKTTQLSFYVCLCTVGSVSWLCRNLQSFYKI